MTSGLTGVQATEYVLHGDELLAKHAAEAHSAMSRFFRTAHRALGEVDLTKWTGEAGDAARFKHDQLRKLMLKHASALDDATLANSWLRGRVALERSVVDEVTTTPLPATAAGLGIPIQGVGTVVVTWMSFGLVVHATVQISKAVELRLPQTASDATAASVAVVTRTAGFLALNYTQGLLSALFFDAAAVGIANQISDDSFRWDGKRIALLALAFTGAEVAGWTTAGVLSSTTALGSTAVASIGGTVAGATGGLAGPGLLTVALGAKIGWGLWFESAAVAVAAGNAVVFLNKLITAKTVITAITNRVFASG